MSEDKADHQKHGKEQDIHNRFPGRWGNLVHEVALPRTYLLREKQVSHGKGYATTEYPKEDEYPTGGKKNEFGEFGDGWLHTLIAPPPARV